MKVLALETSTSSAKVMLYDTFKGVIRTESKPYPQDIEKDGLSNIETVFDLLCSLARKITDTDSDIEAIGLSSIWHSLCATDGNLNPVSPMFSWAFKGAPDIWDSEKSNKRLTEEIYKRTGCMPHSIYGRTAVRYLEQNGLDIKDKKFITQGGYTFLRLTGSFSESLCIQSGIGIINLETEKYDDYVLSLIHAKKEQFGEIVSYKNSMPLTQEGANLLHLKKGIPVIPAFADGALNIVGSNGNRKKVVTMSVGTSGAVRMISEKPVTPKDHSLWCYYGVNSLVSGAATNGACNCVNWFIESFYNRKYSFKELEKNEMKNDLPVFLPFLFGERCPGWDEKRKDGFGKGFEKYSPCEQYQAILMGILFNIYQCYEKLVEANGEPEEILLSGGILNSEKWVQMACDIFKKNIVMSKCADASTVGACALALNAIGELKDINNFTDEYKKTSIVKCNEKNFDYYAKQYLRYLEEYNK